MTEANRKNDKCLTVIYNSNAREVVRQAEALILQGWIPLGGVQSVVLSTTITAKGGNTSGFHTTTTNELNWYWSLWKPREK